jgi:tetratricopeptide (TPR) repeat protein
MSEEFMRYALRLALIAALLAGCASPPPPAAPTDRQGLLHDNLFPKVAVLSYEQIVSLSPEMRSYLETNISPRPYQDERREALINALARNGHLHLEFDAERTRTAAEAFKDRSGNCLSLTVMVGSMAEALGLHSQYQRVVTDETWSRVDNNYLLIGHVNLALSPSNQHVIFPPMSRQDTVIDFLPSEDLHGLNAEPIDESTVVAMFMNNRAVESLVRNDYPTAYAWARSAILQEPGLRDPYNTLGVIYQRAGDVAEAEQVFRELLARKPDDTLAMANLIPVLNRTGRTGEAQKLTAQLHEIEPYPAYYYFNQGRAAMRAGDYASAKALFQREIDRAPYNDEFHFWLASAEAALGDMPNARQELQRALDSSTTRNQHDLYANKLLHLSAQLNAQKQAATTSN